MSHRLTNNGIKAKSIDPRQGNLRSSVAGQSFLSNLSLWLKCGDSESILTFVAIVVATIITTISFRTHNILDYNDATAHLDTARRVIDSLTPGIVQIGSVWLPLLHLLLVPFVSISWLWHNGLAGSIVSGTSFVVLCVYSYKLILRTTRSNKIAAVIASCILLTSPNLLYLQTAAMFEPLLLALTVCSVYYLVAWSESEALSDLIKAAGFTMLATLTRYDAWPFFMATTMLLFAQSLLLRRRSLRGMTLIFISLGGFGIFLWLLYNAMIFGDPLYFQHGPYSAAAQQAVLASRHALPTAHNALLSSRIYITAILYNVGLILPVFAVAGIIWYLRDTWRKPQKWFPWLLLIPLPFNILALYLAQSVIWLPGLPPYFNSYYNARYGILVLPAVVFFCAYLASRRRWLAIIVSVAVLLQVASFVTYFPHLTHQPRGLVTLHDSQSSVGSLTITTGDYIHNNYRGGLILVSSASMDSLIFHSNLPLRDFITEGNGYYWKTSLRYPEKYADWAITFRDHSDAVGKAFQKPGPKTHFRVVYQSETYQVWHKFK